MTIFTDKLDEIKENGMKSITAEKLRLDHEPVAILWSNTKPEEALQIKPQGYSCIMPFFAQVVMNGKRLQYSTVRVMAAQVLAQGLALETATTMH